MGWGGEAIYGVREPWGRGGKVIHWDRFCLGDTQVETKELASGTLESGGVEGSPCWELLHVNNHHIPKRSCEEGCGVRREGGWPGEKDHCVWKRKSSWLRQLRKQIDMQDREEMWDLWFPFLSLFSHSLALFLFRSFSPFPLEIGET